MEHRVARVGKRAEPLADDLLHAFGDADLVDAHVGSPHAVGVLVDRAAFGEAHEHLDREERVAAGLGVHRDRELARLLVELLARRAFDEVGDAVAVEAAQRDAIDAFGAAQVREQRAERMRAVDLGVAVRADHEQVQVRVRCSARGAA